MAVCQIVIGYANQTATRHGVVIPAKWSRGMTTGTFLRFQGLDFGIKILKIALETPRNDSSQQRTYNKLHDTI